MQILRARPSEQQTGRDHPRGICLSLLTNPFTFFSPRFSEEYGRLWMELEEEPGALGFPYLPQHFPPVQNHLRSYFPSPNPFSQVSMRDQGSCRNPWAQSMLLGEERLTFMIISLILQMRFLMLCSVLTTHKHHFLSIYSFI